MKSRIPVLVATVLWAAAAMAGDFIEIRPEAYVKGPVVKLGDVARIEGDNMETLAAVELIPAPRPGQSGTVQASFIEAKLQGQGFDSDQVTITGSGTVRTTTASLQVTDAVIKESLRAFIDAQIPYSTGEVTIDLMVPAFTITVPDGVVDFSWRPSPDYNYLGNGSFRGEILVDDAPVKTVVCRARIEVYGDVVVLVNDVPRGAVIGSRDITIEQRPLSTQSRGVVTDPAEVVGLVARKTLFPDTVLLRRDAIARTVVKRNQMVAVEARSGALRVRSTARAMADAGEGDVIPLLNPDTKEQFTGTVGADGVVSIQIGGL